MKSEQALDYTTPENRDTCGFCGGTENGYAKKDANGEWQAACWMCVRPEKSLEQPKRETVGTVYTEEEPEEDRPKTKRAPGMAPSRRPKTN